jgi:hypothetical protein
MAEAMGKPCKARSAPYDARLFYRAGESDDTVVQTDLTVACDDLKRSGTLSLPFIRRSSTCSVLK